MHLSRPAREQVSVPWKRVVSILKPRTPSNGLQHATVAACSFRLSVPGFQTLESLVPIPESVSGPNHVRARIVPFPVPVPDALRQLLRFQRQVRETANRDSVRRRHSEAGPGTFCRRAGAGLDAAEAAPFRFLEPRTTSWCNGERGTLSDDGSTVYHPDVYKILGDWLFLVVNDSRSGASELLAEAGGISPRLREFLSSIGFEEIWPRLQQNAPITRGSNFQFHRWFDGFKTLKLIHFLRDHQLPESPIFAHRSASTRAARVM